MALGEVLTRATKYEVETSVEGTYVEIKGWTSANPGTTKVDTETTTADSKGEAEHLPSGAEHTLTLEGYWLAEQTESADKFDAGQDRLFEISKLYGHAGRVRIKVIHPNTATDIGLCSVDMSRLRMTGGSEGDRAGWSVMLKVSGGWAYTAKA